MFPSLGLLENFLNSGSGSLYPPEIFDTCSLPLVLPSHITPNLPSDITPNIGLSDSNCSVRLSTIYAETIAPESQESQEIFYSNSWKDKKSRWKVLFSGLQEGLEPEAIAKFFPNYEKVNSEMVCKAFTKKLRIIQAQNNQDGMAILANKMGLEIEELHELKRLIEGNYFILSSFSNPLLPLLSSSNPPLVSTPHVSTGDSSSLVWEEPSSTLVAGEELSLSSGSMVHIPGEGLCPSFILESIPNIGDDEEPYPDSGSTVQAFAEDLSQSFVEETPSYAGSEEFNPDPSSSVQVFVEDPASLPMEPASSYSAGEEFNPDPGSTVQAFAEDLSQSFVEETPSYAGSEEFNPDPSSPVQVLVKDPASLSMEPAPSYPADEEFNSDSDPDPDLTVQVCAKDVSPLDIASIWKDPKLKWELLFTLLVKNNLQIFKIVQKYFNNEDIYKTCISDTCRSLAKRIRNCGNKNDKITKVQKSIGFTEREEDFQELSKFLAERYHEGNPKSDIWKDIKKRWWLLYEECVLNKLDIDRFIEKHFHNQQDYRNRILEWPCCVIALTRKMGDRVVQVLAYLTSSVLMPFQTTTQILAFQDCSFY